MKKFISIVLMLAMVSSLSTTAFAADTIESVTTNNTSTGEVELAVTEGVNDLTVYSVTVAWDDTEMEYQTEGEGTWDPSTHEYIGTTVDGWVDNEAIVTVTNHSNTEVKAEIEADINNTLTYSFNNTVLNLATAEGTLPEDAPYGVFEITAESIPTESVTDIFTVTITDDANVNGGNTEPDFSEDMPIPLYRHYTDENVALDADVANRGNYYIATYFTPELTLNEDGSTNYKITNIEGEYTDGSYFEWQFNDEGGELINMCSAEGTYNVKVTVFDESTSTTKYAYLFIKQDFIY